MLVCPLCRGELTCQAMGQVIQCPHCQGQIQMPFAPPEFADDTPQKPRTSNTTLWVIGSVFLFIFVAVGVVASGVLGLLPQNPASKSPAVPHDPPASMQGQQAVDGLVAKESEGRMKLVGFTRVKGQSRQLLGAPIYEMEYRAELEVVKDCQYVIGTDLIGSGAGILTWPARGKSGAATSAERGARIHVTGSVIWASGESGWRVLEVRVAADQSQKGQATEIGPAP